MQKGVFRPFSSRERKKWFTSPVVAERSNFVQGKKAEKAPVQRVQGVDFKNRRKRKPQEET